jgi:hypothetical protein
MTTGDLLLTALLIAFSMSSLLVAVNPRWLDRNLRKQLGRDISLVSNGAKNSYVKPKTDADRFVRQLRVRAAIAGLLAGTLAAAFIVTSR